VLALGAVSLGLPHSEVILVLTFGVILISNIVQGLSVSSIIRRYGIVDVGSMCDEGNEADSKWMRDSYTPRGFKSESSKLVKLLFATPEYFVFDTKLGFWLAIWFELITSYLHDYLDKKLPKISEGTFWSALLILVEFSSKLSSRISKARRNYYLGKER
jgi:NhaP-type Na+/H+ or K+/H+ antiporter